MSDKYTKLVVNCETGEQSEVPLTAAEIQDRKLQLEMWEKEKAEQDARAQAKAEAKASAHAKLSALGLTEDEIAALS